MIQSIFKILSAEFLIKECANSGYVVFQRSIVVTLLIYVFALSLYSFTREGAELTFSAAQLRTEIHETLPWMGAIFAGVYAALYARFSSQWNYLASLYNQIMATRLQLRTGEYDEDEMRHWEAAFIEDAIAVHLACKDIFAPMIRMLLEDEDVRRIFLETSSNGAKDLAMLSRKLEVNIS